MKPFYIIELHPINKIYFKEIYHAELLKVKDVEEAKIHNSYEDAQKSLAEIVRFNTDQNFYISIIEIYLSLNNY